MRSKCLCWFVWAALVLMVASVGVTALPSAAARGRPSVGARVRAADPETREMLAMGVQASPLMRDLLAALEETDLIVLISLEPPSTWACVSGRRYHGSTRLLGVAGGQRYVAIWIDALWHPGRFHQRRIALLAHELQHALEIAANPDVVDAQSMLSLFGRIGRELWPQHFETDAAVEVESRVAAELRTAFASPQTR